MVQVFEGGAPRQGVFNELAQALQPQIQMSLAQKMGAMEDQRKLEYAQKLYQQQSMVNQQAASSFADQLGYKGPEKKAFAEMFKNVPADQHAKVYKDLQEALMYQQYASGQGGQGGQDISGGMNGFGPAQGFGTGMPQYGMSTQQGVAPEQTAPAQAPVQSEAQPIRPAAPQQAKPVKLGDFTFEPGELPQKQKLVPQVGPLKAQSQFQIQSLGKNRDENVALMKEYQNIDKLRDNLDSAKEMKRLIEEENVDPGQVARYVQAYMEHKNPQLKPIFSTAAQIKLDSLLTNSVQSKNIGGSNPSTREVLIALQRLPSGLNPKEANQYIADRLIEHAEKNIYKAKLGNQLLKYDQHMDSGTFSDLLDRKTKEKFPDKKQSEDGMVRVKSVDGRIGSVSKDELQDALLEGYVQI